MRNKNIMAKKNQTPNVPTAAPETEPEMVAADTILPEVVVEPIQPTSPEVDATEDAIVEPKEQTLLHLSTTKLPKAFGGKSCSVAVTVDGEQAPIAGTAEDARITFKQLAVGTYFTTTGLGTAQLKQKVGKSSYLEYLGTKITKVSATAKMKVKPLSTTTLVHAHE